MRTFKLGRSISVALILFFTTLSPADAQPQPNNWECANLIEMGFEPSKSYVFIEKSQWEGIQKSVGSLMSTSAKAAYIIDAQQREIQVLKQKLKERSLPQT